MNVFDGLQSLLTAPTHQQSSGVLTVQDIDALLATIADDTWTFDDSPYTTILISPHTMRRIDREQRKYNFVLTDGTHRFFQPKPRTRKMKERPVGLKHRKRQIVRMKRERRWYNDIRIGGR